MGRTYRNDSADHDFDDLDMTDEEIDAAAEFFDNLADDRHLDLDGRNWGDL